MMDIGLGSGDLLVAGGDFGIVESTYQHQRQLIMNHKGDYKENPTVCVGAARYQDDDNGPQNVKRAITQEFMNDGMEVETLTPNPDSVVNDTAKIFEDAYYL